MQKFFTHGKLLLTGEYVVLDGALSLAVPTKLGQSLEVKTSPASDKPILEWRSFNSDGELWFSEEYIIDDSSIRPSFFDACNFNPISDKLATILNKARELNPDFLAGNNFEVRTNLEFPNDWGLGSSSTLICNIAKWAEVDAFELSAASFGGSGYDIAVGMMGGDILYRSPEMWEGYVYNPSFKNQLYFVHLNQKQNSREGIANYRKQKVNAADVDTISQITEELIKCTDFDAFHLLITEHEKVISSIIQLPTVKSQLFADYPYALKSLGAWGGDFVLACGDENTPDYFKQKGFETVLNYSQLIK